MSTSNSSGFGKTAVKAGKAGYEASQKLDSVMETIDYLNEFDNQRRIYKDPTSSEQDKLDAGVEIMNTFFKLSGKYVPEGVGGGMLNIAPTIVMDFKNKVDKRTFIMQLQSEWSPTAGDLNDLAMICEHPDELYEAYTIACDEAKKQKFPDNSKQWDMFYESYKEHALTAENIKNNSVSFGRKWNETMENVGASVQEWTEANVKPIAIKAKNVSLSLGRGWVNLWDSVGEKTWDFRENKIKPLFSSFGAKLTPESRHAAKYAVSDAAKSRKFRNVDIVSSESGKNDDNYFTL